MAEIHVLNDAKGQAEVGPPGPGRDVLGESLVHFGVMNNSWQLNTSSKQVERRGKFRFHSVQFYPLHNLCIYQKRVRGCRYDLGDRQCQAW